MSERLTDEQLREWRKTSAGFAVTWPSSTVYLIADELLALRARVVKLEAAARAYIHAVNITANGLSTDASHYERVEKTEDALIAALKDAPQ